MEPLLPSGTNLNQVEHIKLRAYVEKPLFHQGERGNYVLVLENTQDKPLNFIFSGEKAEAYTWLSINEISPQEKVLCEDFPASDLRGEDGWTFDVTVNFELGEVKHWNFNLGEIGFEEELEPGIYEFRAFFGVPPYLSEAEPFEIEIR